MQPQITQFAAKATAEEIESKISTMTLDQITAIIRQINEVNDTKWQEKTRAAILGLTDRKQLESSGHALSLRQALMLIEKTLQIEHQHHWKLSPLLVGMDRQIFSEIISHASKQQLRILQQEGVTEPVQHQLTILTHALTSQVQAIENEIDSLVDDIENLDISHLTRKAVCLLFHHIDTHAEFFERSFDQSSKALAIAWNTKRPDLIEALNTIKNSCQKYSIYVGDRKTDASDSSGLYAALEHKLFEVYGDLDDPNDLEAVRDDEPALEALVKFSVWYLKDYWEMGLLPTIQRRDELDLNLQQHSEIERVEHRARLFSQAKKNLGQIGISTVKDLKNAYIFSKLTLKEYIEEQLK